MAAGTSEFESGSSTAPIESIQPRSADESLNQLISVLQETLQIVFVEINELSEVFINIFSHLQLAGQG